MEHQGSVVGVDLSGLSGSTRGRTWAAELALGNPAQLVSTVQIGRGVAGDRELVAWITERQPLVVAIDAPLTLPHSIFCEDADCPRCAVGAASYLERDVDRLARAGGGAMPFVMLAAIAFRGIYIAKLLVRLGIQVIEAYPAAAYRTMGLMDRDYAGRAAALAERIGPVEWRQPDEVDAICAALVASDYATSRGQKFEGVDGVIWLPSPATVEDAIG